MHQPNGFLAPRLRSFALLAALGVAVAPLAACGGSASTNESSPAGAAAEPASKSTAKPSGIAEMAIDLSLQQTGLRADQKQKIAAVRTELGAAASGVKTARAALAKQIAAAIRQNKIDRVALAPAIDAISAAHEAFRPAEQKALADLHGILDRGQREALVAAGRDKMGDFKGRHGEGHERLEQLADELELSDTQRRAIKDHVRATFLKSMGDKHAEHGDHQARMKEMGEAFASENFDAAKLGIGKDAHPMTRRITDGMLTLVEAALPELTPAQRNKLADHVEQHAGE